MTCHCWPCRRRRGTLAQIAPRIARAQAQAHAERQRALEWLPKLRSLVHRAQWRVDHRDLQLARASAVGSGRYIAERRRKLERARHELAKFRDRLAAAERLAA